MRKVLSGFVLVACFFPLFGMTACDKANSRLEIDPQAIERLFQEEDRYS